VIRITSVTANYAKNCPSLFTTPTRVYTSVMYADIWQVATYGVPNYRQTKYFENFSW